MGIWRSRRAVQHGDQGSAASAAPDGATRTRRAGAAAPSHEDAASIIADLTDRTGWAARVERDPVRAAELADRFRARAARLEAQRELERLRTWHWSGDRIVQEGRRPMEWWEHCDADPYAVLDLLPGAPLTDAAAARRRIARECHPDRVSDGVDPELARRRMIAANAAYDRLRRALQPI